jgi:hypothetical protein
MGPDCRKERWAAGASEVHCIRYLSNYNLDYHQDTGPYVVEYQGRGEDEGDKIAEVSRKNSKKNPNAIAVDFNIVEDWSNSLFDTYRNHIFMVIFEYDPWPSALNKDAKWERGSKSFTITYRSADKDSYYIKDDFNRWNAHQRSYSGCLKMQTLF